MYICPKCGGEIDRKSDRIHRRLHERLLSLIVPARRYECGACSWRGLLRVNRMQESEPMSTVPANVVARNDH